MSSVRFLCMQGSLINGILSRVKCPQCLALSASKGSRPFATSSSEADFEAAKGQLNALKTTPDRQAQLRIYALFKQATVGICDRTKPTDSDVIQSAKWAAWNDLSSMTKEDARQRYVNIVNELAREDDHVTEAAGGREDEITTFKYLIYEVEGKAAKITLNRPKMKNALNRELFYEVPAALKKAGEDPNISLAVLTGAGEYYCSGNDLNNLANIYGDELKETCELGGRILEDYMISFIDFPKPLIAAVNGPALGLAVTTLALCDIVYATEKATFMTPFSALGLTPEGCSSYLFPKIMGHARANEILLFGRHLSAQDAEERGLITEVFKDASFHAEVKRRVAKYSQLPPKSMRATKGIVKLWEMEELKRTNKEECETLVRFWQGQEFISAVSKFLGRKPT